MNTLTVELTNYQYKLQTMSEALTMCSMNLSSDGLEADASAEKPTQTQSGEISNTTSDESREKLSMDRQFDDFFVGEIDLYQEEGGDNGPRCLLQPIQIDPRTSADTQLDFVEAVTTFNDGLEHHQRQEIEESRVVYECILYYTYGLLQSFNPEEVPSSTLLTLGMQAHNNLGTISYANDLCEDALGNFDAALIFARQLLQRDKHQQLAIASVVSNWCRVHWVQGDIDTDSLFQCMEDVLRLRADNLPWYHVDVAASHFNLGTAYHAIGRHDKAMSHLKQYLKVSEYRAGNQMKQVDPIPALIYLLLIQVEDKDNTESQDLARALRALQDKRQEQGNSSPEVASIINHVGTLLFHNKDFSNALMFFQEELRIEKGLDQCEPMSISVTCNNIARTLQEQDKLMEAMTFYQYALRFDTLLSTAADGSKSDQHEVVSNLFSTVWYNLGLIYDKLGDAAEAIRAFQVSLDLRIVVLGPLHPDIACLWYNIGVLQMEKGFLDDSENSFIQALRIRSSCQEHQLKDERMLKTIQKLSDLQKDAGNLRGAIVALDQVVYVLQNSTFHFSVRQRQLSSTLLKIAELYHDLNDNAISLTIARRAIEAIEPVMPNVLMENEETQVSIGERHAIVEQWAMSHLLVGSLLHETFESERAYQILQDLLSALTLFLNNPIFSSSSLAMLAKVVELLATPQCAVLA
jgi:tetratricopeptide (TPR) repeat protein